MANYKTPFYKMGMASTPFYQVKADDYNPNTNEKITGESTTSIKAVINGRKGTLTTSRRNFASPGDANTSTSNNNNGPKMSDNEWRAYLKANPKRNKGSNRTSKKETFIPDPETPMELPTPKPVTFGNGLTGQPIKPMPVPVASDISEEGGFGGSNIARFSDEKERGGNLFKTTGSKKYGCPGGCP